MVEQRLTVAAAHGAGKRRQVLVETAKHFQHGVFVGDEDVAPHGRIGRGDAGEVAETAGGELQHFRARNLRKLVGGADDGIGDQMRQMAGNPEHQIVVIRRHGLDIGAERPPEGGEPLHRASVRILRRSQNAPAIDEEFGEAGIRAGIFGAGDRMARNEMHPRGQVRGHIPQHRAFDRADIGHKRPGL